MIVRVLKEAGYEEALLGISLSYDQDPELMPDVAKKLAAKGGGENKFLESMVVWLDITAPRYWWSQFDTYRIGITKQSQSTMHTVMRRALGQDDFAVSVSPGALLALNELIESGNLILVKGNLPEGFLQRRIVCANYKALRNIISQRKNHRLAEWRTFIDAIISGVEHPEFLRDADKPQDMAALELK
jgi:hypothetical protein